MTLVDVPRGTRLQPIPAGRIRPRGFFRDVPGDTPPGEWSCTRCGRDVIGREQHLVAYAPCRDCREYLFIEEGDDTVYDVRVLSRRRGGAQTRRRMALVWHGPDLEPPDIRITVRRLGFPLAAVGAEIHAEPEGYWAV
jgi:hypothetical protein